MKKQQILENDGTPSQGGVTETGYFNSYSKPVAKSANSD